MKTIILTIIALAFCTLQLHAQYVEPEKSEKLKAQSKITYPSTPFDSVATRNALALGKSTLKGVAFTRLKNGYGIKTGNKIKGNKITVVLFPVTPYFEEYYKLWKDKKYNNPKKNRFVYMDEKAYILRLEAITNSDGEFTFPEMLPGKYYIYATLGYTKTKSYNRYTGSGYGSYGGRVDYYQPTLYSENFSDLLEKFIEIKKNGEVVDVKLR
ncbi:MAG: carboxypeptidase-like regulatory domain-containing protein [Capnocytophaga sp.]|nr:carboxypeptidase-like regulatory domain-containing protein [Capnocytophaga sp.]